MSKVLRVVAVVASIAAFAIPIVGPMIGMSIQAIATATAIASAVAAVASAGAVALQKKPDMKGSVNQVVIGNNTPIFYSVGETYVGGAQIFEGSDGEDNKYRHMINVVSAAGPIEQYEAILLDYVGTGLTFTGGYYAGWIDASYRYGTRPDSAFTAPGFTSDHKLSGYAAYKVRLKFDKDGKRFSGGVPQIGVKGKFVKVYDPRLDSTYPGGSGSHRWDDESTFAWSENPGLHALTYARGRFIEKDAAGDPLDPPVKIVGIGLPWESIDVAAFVAFANLCDANGWKVGGTVYEGPQMSKWDNLKRFTEAGAASPLWSGGRLSLLMSTPHTPLFTITADDVVDGQVQVVAMKPKKDRINSMVARFRHAPHRWEYVQLRAVTADTYLAEDGELKTKELQFDLVQQVDQAAQMAAYQVVNSREFSWTFTVRPGFMLYRLGEAGIAHIPEAGLSNQLGVITQRSVDPATGMVTLTMESETTAKHLYALGVSGVAPPSPTIIDPQDLDDAAYDPSVAIGLSYPVGLTITVEEDGDIVISDHIRRYTDGHDDVAVDGATIASGLPAGTFRAIAYDDYARVGGAVTYDLYAASVDARVSTANPGRHYVGYAVIPTAGSGSAPGTGGEGPGGPCVTTDTPVLMADGSEKPAGELAVGDWLRTRDEATLEWGDYPVEAIELVEDQALFAATIGGKALRGTAKHRVFVAGEWRHLDELGVEDGTGTVVRLTVTGAHTYVSNGILSHNLKALE